MKTNKITLSIIGAITVNLMLTGCSESSKPGEPQSSQSASTGTTTEQLQSHAYNINLYPVNKLVCDPFSDGTASTEAQYGIKASLYYIPKGNPIPAKVDDYIKQGVASNQSLFFTDLFVPTRLFNKGFSTLSGDVVKDNNGTMLVEYFAMEFESQLSLPSELEEGDYELATLADDGSVIELQLDGQWTKIVNNDGNHPTRMGCATGSINLTHQSLIPFKAKYYQGPKYHIAHTLLWRKVDQNTQRDPECGKQGNNYFFNPDKQSIPLAPYNNLLSRGWSPVPPKAFVVSAATSYNPCVTETGPQITNFQPGDVDTEFVTFIWNTDVLATSQVEITDLDTGSVELTVSDNYLRTSHQILVYNLIPGHHYQIRAVSIGENLGKTISDPINFSY